MRWLYIAIAALTIPLACFGQGQLSPYHKAILDLYYYPTTNGKIHGTNIIDGTISTGKLDVAIVLYADYSSFTNSFAQYTNVVFNIILHHTNNPSAHYRSKTVSANYTITTNDYTVMINAGSQVVTATVPTAANSPEYIFNIKSINSSNRVHVVPSGTENIDGSTNFLLYTDESITIQSDGANWFIL